MRSHISFSKDHPLVVQMWAFETETIMLVAIGWVLLFFFPSYWGVYEGSELFDLMLVF